MRHAGPEDLDRIEPLLARLREIAALAEKSRGVFYLRGRACLHFHADPSGMYADVRTAGAEFDRVKIDGQAAADALIDRLAGLK